MDGRNPHPSQPYRKPWKMRNIVGVKPRPGRYRLYSKDGKVLYAGSSKNLRRRLEDKYRLRGDARTVKTQHELLASGRVKKFDIDYGKNIWDNRDAEKKEKQGAPFNVK